MGKFLTQTPSNMEIIHMFENEGMSVEEIATARDYEVVAVKNILSIGSKQYRDECKTSEEELISDAEARSIVEAMKGLGFSAENELVRFNALKYLFDEKKGRNDKKETQAVSLNVQLLNTELKKIKQLEESRPVRSMMAPISKQLTDVDRSTSAPGPVVEISDSDLVEA